MLTLRSILILCVMTIILTALGLRHDAQAQEPPSKEHEEILRVICLKHGLDELPCFALMAEMTAPPLAIDASSLVQGLFDPAYRAERLKEMAETYDADPAAMAGAAYDYEVWKRAGQSQAPVPFQ